MNNHEDFVTYVQAVKLKELGFDWLSNRYYCKEDCADGQVWEYSCHPPQNYSDSPRRFTAPTLAQAQKWLREVKQIIVIPCVMHIEDIMKYDFYIADEPIDLLDDSEGYDTYEQALSAGIDKALELLKSL